MEENKQTDLTNEELIKAIREEYEKKLEEQKAQFEAEKQKIEEDHKKTIEENEARHIRQTRALIMGRKDESYGEQQKEKPKSFEEDLIEKLRKKNKLI